MKSSVKSANANDNVTLASAEKEIAWNGMEISLMWLWSNDINNNDKVKPDATRQQVAYLQ